MDSIVDWFFFYIYIYFLWPKIVFDSFFMMLPNIEKHGNYLYTRFSIETVEGQNLATISLHKITKWRTNFVLSQYCRYLVYLQYWGRTKFSYQIGCSFRLQSYSISFYCEWILTNPLLDYIFFLYLLCLQNF